MSRDRDVALYCGKCGRRVDDRGPALRHYDDLLDSHAPVPVWGIWEAMTEVRRQAVRAERGLGTFSALKRLSAPTEAQQDALDALHRLEYGPPFPESHVFACPCEWCDLDQKRAREAL